MTDLAAPDRLAALRATGLLDTPPDGAFDHLTRLATRLLGVPASVVSLVLPDRQVNLGGDGLDEPLASERQLPISHSFCRHVVASGEPLVIADATLDALVCENPSIVKHHVRAYAGVPVRTPDGYVMGSFCAFDSSPKQWSDADVEILHDLAAAATTEAALRTSSRALEQAKRDADRASQAKSDLLSRASHELRTPLNAVIGFSTALLKNRRGTFAPSDLTFLERIRTNGMHLLSIVDDILDVAKAEAGRMTLELTQVDLLELVDDVRSTLDGLASDKGIALRTEIPDDVQPFITDRAKLKQVLINLIGNAIKFTGDGAVTVRVQTDARATPKTIVVEDTGCGIAPADLQRIFEPFAQSDAPRDPKASGTGLGLTIARSFCEALGYRLRAESTPGTGSRMIVELT